MFNQNSTTKGNLAVKVFEIMSGKSDIIETVEIPLTLEVGETERIGIDDVIESESDRNRTILASHLQSEQGAVEMFLQRLKIISSYVELVQTQTITPDYEILRQISSFVSKLTYNNILRDALDEQKLDVISEALVSLTTKGSYIGMDLSAKNKIYGM